MFIKGCILLLFILFCTGCWLTDMKKDPVTGQDITNAEDITKKVQGAMIPAAPIANTFVPGSGIIIAGIATLLGLAGTAVTAIVKANRNGGALAAVIHGVQLANNEDTKAKIKSVAGDLGIEPYLKSIVKKYFPTKAGGIISGDPTLRVPTGVINSVVNK